MKKNYVSPICKFRYVVLDNICAGSSDTSETEGGFGTKTDKEETAEEGAGGAAKHTWGPDL